MLLDILIWTATAFSFLYLYLIMQSNRWGFVAAIVGCAIWAYVSYESQLMSDALLQLFYIGAAVVGWFRWSSNENGALLPIKSMPWWEHVIVFAVGIPVAYVMGTYLGENFMAVATYWDAYTTVFSVIITCAVVTRRLENWLYWIVIDVVTGALYFSRGLWPFGLVMIAYTIVAVQGYRQWRKQVPPEGLAKA